MESAYNTALKEKSCTIVNLYSFLNSKPTAYTNDVSVEYELSAF